MHSTSLARGTLVTALCATALLSACDHPFGPGDPVIVELEARVTPPIFNGTPFPFGGALLTLDGPVEGVESDAAHVLLYRGADATLVALIAPEPVAEIPFRILMVQGDPAPEPEVLEASGVTNLPLNTDHFAVEVDDAELR